MSQLAVERALGRLITDVEFRAEFFEDTVQACHHHGLELTQVELTALLCVDPQALQKLTMCLDGRIVRATSFRLSDGDGRLSSSQKRRGTLAK